MVKEGEGSDWELKKGWGWWREREGAKARSCNNRPPDYIVAQINRPSAGSLESSCSAGQESFHFRGLRLSYRQVMGWGLAVYRHRFPTSPSVSW